MTKQTVDSAGPTAVSAVSNENVNVSTSDESESEGMADQRRRHKKRKRWVKPRQSFVANYDVAGVVRIILTPSSQVMVKCIVGEHVTAENPWGHISKDSIEYHMEVFEDKSEFIPYKDDILLYPKEEFLIGYIPDEAREFDEFYLCLTLEAEDNVSVTLAKVLERQQKRLNNSILKQVGSWIDLGSSADVEETLYKTSRALIEVEIEAKYPIISSKIQFRLKLAQDIEDGYAEFKQDKASFNHVMRRRVDCAVQVAPPLVNNVAQTTCAFPKNTWTQYHYEFDPVLNLSKEFDETFKHFTQTVVPNICDIITVNNKFNLFTNDYKDLVTNPNTQKASHKVELLEYNSFTDIKYCKYKMVSYVSWHPLITGIMAVCYKTIAPNAYTTYKPDLDYVNFQVHSTHVVLVWSFRDVLEARLYLEAPREINVVSWCPYNENILIGGLSNGQIAIWDTTNMIDRVEKEEILTYAQQKYRVLMYSFMEWFQNTKDVQRIRCTAVSNLQFSHEGPITSISWIHPDCEITRTGQIVNLPEDRQRSMQFSTTSVDGTCMYWDLKGKITLQPGDYRPQRRSRRLKNRPSALTVDVSPLRILNRLIKPIFIVNMRIPNMEHLYISCYNRCKPTINYIPINPVKNKAKQRMDDRIYHTPVPVSMPTDCSQEFYAGTLDGYFFNGCWEGFEVDSGEVINKINCRILNIGRFHDGPIVSISRNKVFPYILLTVGGKVLAIWSEHLPNKPILWRRSRHRYTYGAWNIARRSLFRICRSDGNRETWSVLEKSDTHMFEQSLSGKILTGSYIHKLKMKNNVNAVADYNGTIRLLYTPTQIGLGLINSDYEADENKKLSDQFEHEVIRKKLFVAWQEAWMKKHAEWIKAKKEHEQIQLALKEEAIQAEKIRLEEEKLRLEREQLKDKESKLRPLPGRYLEWAKEKHLEQEQKRMAQILLTKKHLDPVILRKQQAPLRAIKKDQRRKKLKQKERIQHSEQLFNETVAMLFPNVVNKRVIEYVDPYAGGDLPEVKEECMELFEQSIDQATEYIQDHVYGYVLDWKQVLSTGRERRRKLELPKEYQSHRDRLIKEKKAKEFEVEEFVRKRMSVVSTKFNKSTRRSMMSTKSLKLSKADDDDYSADKEDN